LLGIFRVSLLGVSSAFTPAGAPRQPVVDLIGFDCGCMGNGMISYEQMFMDSSQERDAALLVKENSEFRQSELGRS
jgi:hypothetical protein